MKKFDFSKLRGSILLMLFMMCALIGFSQGTDDFQTLPTSNSYLTNTSTAGWYVVNSAVGAPTATPTSVGTCGRQHVIINGKTSVVGSITSPTITGGCGTLSFNFAHLYSENNGANFSVKLVNPEDNTVILYDTTVVIANADIVKGTIYNFVAEVNVAADFVLVISNNSPSNFNGSGNKDRVAIGCIEWTAYTTPADPDPETPTPDDPIVINNDSIATLPYAYNFDDGVDPYFMINNGENTNAWYIGQAQGFDNNKLYISSNGGTTNKYDITKASTVTAYRDVMIPETGAVLTFDYRVNGQSNTTDYLKVDLNGNEIARLVGENDWTSFSYDISGELAGEVRVKFTWVNNATNGNQFPAAIDNISVIETPCSQPTALAATMDSTTAVITWQAVEGQTAWNFQYKLADYSEWYTVPATATTLTLTDLQGNSNYDMRVQAVCGEYTSAWTTGTFAVACQTEIIIAEQEDIVIGTGTSASTTTCIFPGYYGWQYGAHLYEMENTNAKHTIHSIAFYLNAAVSTTGSTMTVWVKAVDGDYALAASNTFNGMLEGAQQIYDGAPDFSAAGWMTFPVENFSLAAGQNLLVLVRGVGCTTSGGCSKSARYTSATNKMWYKRQDTNDPGQEVAGSLGSYRANITINATISTCSDVIACANPSNLTVDNVTANSAELTWTAGVEGQNNFIVEYMAEGATEWTSMEVTGTTYTLTELAQMTYYSVKVKANCGENNWSDVITAIFRTEGICAPVTNMETSNISNTTTLTWLPGGEESAWLVQFKPASEGDDAWTSINVNLIPMTTFGGLVGNTDYDVRVKALCDPTDEENQSEWASTTFHSGCAAFEVPFTEEFPTNTMPICWENQDFHFASSGYAYSYTNGAELISPAINIPAENPTYLSFEVRGAGDYTVLASYRGTRADRFETIYTGTAPNQNTVVTIEIDNLYKGRAVNFKIVNNSTSYQYFYNVKVNQCPFEVTALNAVGYTGTTVDLAWEADEAATNFQVQYGEVGFVLGEGTNVDVTDTTAATVTGLNYETAYDFYVRVVCAGDNGAWFGPVSATTAPSCSDPTITEYEFNNGSLMVFWTAGEWGTPSLYNVRYKAVEDAEYTYTTVTPVAMPDYTPFVTISGLASNATYEIGVQSVCGENMESNWVNMEVTTPCLPLAIPYTQDFEGDVFPPECWSQEYVTGNIDWEVENGAAMFSDEDGSETRLLTPPFDLSAALRDAVLSFTHQQAVWVSDQDELRVYYRTSSNGSWNLLAEYTEDIPNMTPVEITLPAAALTSYCQFAFVGQGNYGYGVYVDDFGIDWAPSCGAPTLAVEIPTATITPNVYGTPTAYEIMIGDASQIVTTTTVNLSSYLTIGEEYDVKVRSICGEGDTSAWSNTVHFLYMVSSNIDDQTTLTTCGVMLYDNGGADENYESSSDNTVTIYPETSTSVIHLTGEYNTESGWDKIYIYDGTSTSATQIGEYSGTGTLDILATNAAGALTINFTSDGSANYSGFAFLISCFERPSCGTPTVTVSVTEATITPNPMATTTPTAYELRIGDAIQTVTTTTVNLDDYFTLEVDNEYELFVRAICGDNDASDWTSVTFVKPIACSGTVEAYEITGTSATTSYLPSYSYYNYSLTQQMYLASEIEVPQGGIIYSLSLNVTTAKSRTVDIYVGTTTASNLSSWVPAANFQLVYSGTAFDHTGTNEFTFTNPIIYNGTDNLVVMVDDNTGSYVSGLAAASHSGATNRAKYVYSDGTNYSVTSVTTYSGTTTSTRNNIVFNICANPEPTCPAPKNITVGNVTETTAEVSWTAGSSETEWEVSYTVGDQTTTETTTNNPYTITGLTASTMYDIPFSIKAICSATDESTVNNTTLSFNTVCGLATLPFSENFDTYPGTTSQASMVMPLCWNKKFMGTSTSYGVGIYNSSSYAVSGTNSLRFYNYCTTSTSTSYGNAYAVLPQMERPVDELMISFRVNTSTSTTTPAFFEIGVITDVNATNYDNEFQPIGSAYIVPTGGQDYNILLSDYTGADGHIAIRVAKTKPSGETRTGNYPYVYIDNVLVERIPTCFVPSQLTATEVTDHTATISWTDNHNQTNFAVEYKAEGEDTWNTVNATTTTCPLSNLAASTEYTVRVKAVCGTDDESEYTDEITFITVCEHGVATTIAGTGGTTYYLPVDNYYHYSYTQQIIDAAEMGGTGVIGSISFEYNYATPMSAKNNVKIYLGNTDKSVFESTTDWVTTGLQEVYSGALNCSQGWNDFALTTPFMYNGGNVVVVIEDMSDDYDGSSYTFKQTTTSGYKGMYYHNDSNPFTGSNTASGRTTYRSNMKLIGCPDPYDVAVVEVNNIPDACEVEGAVAVTVQNNGYEPVSAFAVSYQLNDATPVQENVTLSTPLAMGETTIHTFAQIPTFVEGSYTITASVAMDGDANETNNSITSEPIVVLAPATVPYEEAFTGLTINHGWNPIDANNDGITMNLNNDINYTFNDEAAADDWMMSPCIEMAAGTYTIIYDYKANSSLTEAFEVYYGNGNHVADMTNAVATHSFNNTTYETATNTITIAADGVYNFGFHATSLAGNLGFSIDNFKVYPVNDVVVTYNELGGTVTPNGTIAVNYGENLTLNLVPNQMYHVAGVWVDDVQVVPEDGTGANFMLYTLENVTEPHTVYVDFKLEFHFFKLVENYREDLYSDLGGAFVPAAIDTTLDPAPFTLNMVADPHYHLYSLEVAYADPDHVGDWFDVTTGVDNNGDGTYTYVTDSLNTANYTYKATFRRDTVAINYNVLTGKGHANGSPVLNTGDTYTTWVDYSVNNDVDTTISFAGYDNYHVVDVIVNGTSMNHIENYTFENVTETQNVDIKFGYKVDAFVSNYNTYDNIQDPQGTLLPETKYVAEFDPDTLRGTVNEHFHLYQLLVNGVDRIGEVVFDPEDSHIYYFILDSVDNNYTIEAKLKVDTFAITYNIVNGQGYVENAEGVVEGQFLVAPASYYHNHNYGDNWLTTITPATGYSIGNVTLDGENLYTASNYQFNYLVESHEFYVTFEPNVYTITTNAFGNGTVSNDTSFTYAPNTEFNYNFNATAGEGYYIASITINNVAVDLTGVDGTFDTTLSNVAENYNINVIFQMYTYTMEAVAGDGGTITPEGTQIVNYGTDMNYVIAANEGWYIASTVIDGVTTNYTQTDSMTTLTVPYTAINDNHSVSVSFDQFMYTITGTVGANGTVNGATTINVELVYGSNYAMTITPAANYQIADVIIDNTSVGAVNFYEFINITADHTVDVTFEAIMYTLTATSNTEGCTITPADTTVQSGSSVTYTITAATGYHLDNVVINGALYPIPANTFTIDSVQSDYTILANFAQDMVTVTVNQPAHATITPGTMTYAYGSTPIYMIVPEVGYNVNTVTANGATVSVTYNNGIGTFTLDSLVQDVTVTATTCIKTYTITVTQGANGTIAPGTQTGVEYGSSKTFTITPNQYYVIADVIVDGSSRGALSSYTFNNVTGNHTITAVFEADCQMPTNLMATNIDTTSATLTWEGTATSYEVRYMAAGESSFHTQTVNSTSVTLTGLTPNTLYGWGVRANCGSQLTSDWAVSAFTTNAVPVNPEDPSVGIANADLKSVKVYSYQSNVYIVNEEGVAISDVAIYDIYGKQVYVGKVVSSPEVISLNVANGTYVVRLATENGVGVYKVAIVR